MAGPRTAPLLVDAKVTRERGSWWLEEAFLATEPACSLDLTDPGPAGSCQVSLLVPHPGRTAVLVADGGAPSGTSRPPPRLPTLLMGSAEPSLPDILAAVDVVDTATAAALRLVMTSGR